MSLGPPVNRPKPPEPKERPHPDNPRIIIGVDGKWRTVDHQPGNVPSKPKLPDLSDGTYEDWVGAW